MSQSGTAAYRWTFIGGHLALDLCNTRSWRLDPARSTDRLVTPQHLRDWFTAGDERAVHRVPTETTLTAVRKLRDAAIRTVDAHLDRVPGRVSDTEHLTAAWRRALAVAATPDGLPWRWQLDQPPVASQVAGDLNAVVDPGDRDRLVHTLALLIADLLQGPDLSGLRRCDGEGCGWLFLDTSRNHSRRWCDPQDCGNRARVRAYTERNRRTGQHRSGT